MNKRIKVIAGPICSGKTTWCDHVMKTLEQQGIPSKYIKVSSVVKRLSTASTRQALQKTGDLHDQISQELNKEIEKSFEENDVMLVDGIRQLDILLQLLEYFTSRDTVVELTWLEVDKHERLRRFNARKQPRDLDIGFEEANQNDNDLGLGNLERFLKLTYIHK